MLKTPVLGFTQESYPDPVNLLLGEGPERETGRKQNAISNESLFSAAYNR